jgi:hypothetical protein
MTPEERDFAVAVTANLRNLALAVEQLASLLGFDQTAEKARQVGDDVRDAHNQMEGM